MQPDLHEALRYLGVHAPDDAMLAQMAQAADLVCAACKPRWVWRSCTLDRTAEGWMLPEAGLLLPGASAEKMLATCQQAVLLVCSLGAGFDALVRTWQHRDMAMAVMLDACGSAYVEAGCNEAEREIAAAHPGLYLTDRFSPGYGDLPLSCQAQLLAAANAARRLGVTLTDSCLMNPSKSVTAIIGIAEEPQRARIRGCAYCAMAKHCAIRQRGDTCGA